MSFQLRQGAKVNRAVEGFACGDVPDFFVPLRISTVEGIPSFRPRDEVDFCQRLSAATFRPDEQDRSLAAPRTSPR